MITYGLSKSDRDLKYILRLQQANLAKAISNKEAKQEGFVSVVHDLNLLKKMQHSHPHIVARDGKAVVGYTLVMTTEFKYSIPALVPMFEKTEETVYQGMALKNYKYVIMGQVCIGKKYRGQGIFINLYAEMSKQMKIAGFDFIITEISSRNSRSLRAHEKAGFEVLQIYQEGGEEEWVVVLLKL